MRLNKFLAQAGLASRREADRMIQEGRVRLNGRVVTELGVKVDEHKDRVEVDNRPVRLPSEHVYLLLNKPAGYIVTVDDPQQRKTVMELLPRLPVRVFPVGRLDAETEGLLLFTNDGELAHRLTHPRYEVKKLYEVKVKGFVEDKELEKLEKGIFIDGRKTAPARARIIYRNREKSLLSLEIHEGRKHEVRKMLYALGFEVKKLRRVSFAGLTIKGLRRGFWRRLRPEEVDRLKKMTGLAD
ncbi:MAG: rRNA pseudouridine synthase [Candidatus Aminicenantes bacterium]|nr:rRNA pseudouridine synthase [Candidatus Aminicenantes bacterium]